MYYWGERAKGGAGLIITEEMTVHPTDRAYEKLIDVYHSEVIPGFKKITNYVHQYDAKIFAQLNHNGQQCDGSISRLPVWAPSPMPDVLFREVPKAMEPEDIEEVARYFAKSAIHVRAGGFDGIELQFGHSSLARQFLSPLTNFRQDEFGGSLENRMRAPLMFIEAVRKAVGKDFTLGIRMCADEMIPGGLDLAQVQEIGARFEASGLIDFMDLSIATFYNLYLVEGSMHTPLGYTIPLAAGMREKLKLPVFCTGRINDPTMAERVLAIGPGRHDRHVPGADLRPVPPQKGPGRAAGRPPLLRGRQPELHRPDRHEQDPRLHPEPGRRAGKGVGRRDPEAGAGEEEGDDRRRRTRRDVGRQDGRPPRAQGHPLRPGNGTGRPGPHRRQGGGPRRVRCPHPQRKGAGDQGRRDGPPGDRGHHRAGPGGEARRGDHRHRQRPQGVPGGRRRRPRRLQRLAGAQG